MVGAMSMGVVLLGFVKEEHLSPILDMQNNVVRGLHS